MYLRNMKGHIIFFLLFLACAVDAQDSLYMPLIGRDIHLLRFGDDSTDVLMYNMHDNENTSALAGRIIARKYGGEYYELIHNGKRNISFLYGSDSIHIDPNRIYTDAGIWLQLEKNKIRDTIVHQLISVWRDSLLSVMEIRKRALVIALHNNTDDNYGVHSYMSEGEYEMEAYALYLTRQADMDDFYFVTDHNILQKLSIGRYPIVLQDNRTMTDDGSLSVYCGQLKIPYINVEAQHGHLLRQLRMLIFAFQHLVESGK